jgi:hypothetical protein
VKAEGKSRYEKMRAAGAIRSALIAYGIGAFVYFFPRPQPGIEGEPHLTTTPGVAQTILVGVVLQTVAFAIRRIAARYERSRGLEGIVSPLTLYIFDIVVDAVTVLLFAIATFRGIGSFNTSL